MLQQHVTEAALIETTNDLLSLTREIIRRKFYLNLFKFDWTFGSNDHYIFSIISRVLIGIKDTNKTINFFRLKHLFKITVYDSIHAFRFKVLTNSLIELILDKSPAEKSYCMCIIRLLFVCSCLHYPSINFYKLLNRQTQATTQLLQSSLI